MGTVPFFFERTPEKPEANYPWINVLWIVALLFFVFWNMHQQGNHESVVPFLILGFVIPDLLCGKFKTNQKPQKSNQDILSKSKPLQITCWIVAIAILFVAILGGLGVHPMFDILNAVDALPAWIDHAFDQIPFWLVALLGVVFFPVFRVATYIEKQVCLQWVWASAASAIALAILYVQHRWT